MDSVLVHLVTRICTDRSSLPQGRFVTILFWSFLVSLSLPPNTCVVADQSALAAIFFGKWSFIRVDILSSLSSATTTCRIAASLSIRALILLMRTTCHLVNVDGTAISNVISDISLIISYGHSQMSCSCSHISVVRTSTMSPTAKFLVRYPISYFYIMVDKAFTSLSSTMAVLVSR